MNGNALSMAMRVLQSVPGLVSAGVDIANLIGGTLTTLHQAQMEKRDPTDAEWAAMHATIDSLRSQLDKPE